MRLGATPNLIVTPNGKDDLPSQIDAAVAAGLNALNVRLRDLSTDNAYLENAAAYAAKKDVMLVGFGTGANFYLTGAEADAQHERLTELILRARKHLGLTIVGTPPGPMSMQRWAPGPPLGERKARVAANLRRLGAAVQSSGVTLALENHCDWRGHEVADIIVRAGQANLGVQIDTGNAFSVFEEPVECARALAPYIVSSHFKDVLCTPFATGPARGSRVTSVPLGQGSTDNRTICDIIVRETPNGRSIPLLIEPFYLDDDQSPREFLAASVRWAKENLAEYLD